MKKIIAISWKRLIVYLILLPTIPFIIGVFGMLVIANFPGNYSSFEAGAQINNSVRHAIVFAHGKDASPETWIHALKGDNSLGLTSNSGTAVLIPDWSNWAGNFLRVSINGLSLGRKLGAQLLKKEKLESVHVLGHSAGAFFAYGVCQAIKKGNSKITVQTTYIAPLSLYGGFLREFGIDNFGLCGDFSDTYFDQEDHVPGANIPLGQAHSFDLTQIRQNPPFNIYSAHASPLYFYGQALIDGRTPLLRDSPDISTRFVPGEITIVTEPNYSFHVR